MNRRLKQTQLRRLASRSMKVLPMLQKAPLQNALKTQRSPIGIQTRSVQRMNSFSSVCKNKKTIEAYQIIRTVGTGTFSTVKLAICKETQQPIVLKIMVKNTIILKKQIDHIKSERRFLEQLDSPFIVKMLESFQDDRYLYLVLEYVQGGELYTHLRFSRTFDIERARFYAAEMVCVFSYLHSNNLVYRDLKPENVLITPQGHLKLVDLGFIKQLLPGEQTYTLCGTPEYLPPEIIQKTGHSFPADWWTLGIFLYEMLTGRTPFGNRDPYRIYGRILHSSYAEPDIRDCNAFDLISKLLIKDPQYRITEQGVKQHPFFTKINWELVEHGKIPAPFIPHVLSPTDSANFDKYPESKDSATFCPNKKAFADFQLSSQLFVPKQQKWERIRIRQR